MRTFSYKAVTKQGAETAGTVMAPSHQDAITRLKEQGLYVTEIGPFSESTASGPPVTRSRSLLARLLKPRVRSKHLVSFTSDMAVLLSSGVTLIRALSIMYNQTLSSGMRAVVGELRSDVEAGQPLSDALAKHPYYFSELYVNMVRAGELSGMLGVTLTRLAVLYEKSAHIENKIRAAMTYPVVVIVFAMVVVVFIVGGIVPKFFAIFADIGASLPLITRMLYRMSMALRSYGPFIAIGLVGIVLVLRMLMGLPTVRRLMDHMVLKLPVFGMVASKTSIARFCRTFSTLLASGVPILQTLSVARDAAGNSVYAHAIEQVKESIKEGESVAAPLAHCRLFPPLVINMIMVGEETGTLSQMLAKVADRYDDDVDTAISQLSSLIEPFLIIGLGIIVAFIVISLFLPLVSLVQNLTSG